MFLYTRGLCRQNLVSLANKMSSDDEDIVSILVILNLLTRIKKWLDLTFYYLFQFLYSNPSVLALNQIDPTMMQNKNYVLNV